jgi:hypothetical protein
MANQIENQWIANAINKFMLICQQLQEQISSASDGQILNSAERHLQANMRQLLNYVQQQALQEELQRRSQTQRFITCQRCGRRMRHRGYHNRSFISQIGYIRLRGPYLYCRCGNSHSIREIVSGQGNITTGLLELILRYSATMPSARVAKYLVKDFGLRFSDEYIRQLSIGYGQKLASLRNEHKSGGRWELSEQDLYGYADGVMINIRSEGWKECKLLQCEGPQNSQVRLRAVLGNSQKFGRMLRREAIGVGASKAGRIIFVMDAAAGFARQVGTNIPTARQIVDYWHACQHIADCAVVLYGQESRACQDWRSVHCELLRQQGPGPLQDVLGKQYKRFRKASKRQSLRKLMEFIERHRARMEYPAFIAEGLKVDSGPVESSCKAVIGGRLKGSGMRWSRQGANSMLELRTALFSDLWDDGITVLSA